MFVICFNDEWMEFCYYDCENCLHDVTPENE